MEQLQHLRKKQTAIEKENAKHKVELMRANKVIAKKDRQVGYCNVYMCAVC
jgi:hypothetical protein